MIVSNTTPLSNFLHLERMDILSKMFHEIHLPGIVKDEIERFFPNHPVWKRFLETQFFITHHIPSHVKAFDFFNPLHPGEAEALWLCLDQQASLFLVDDKNARTFATLNQIKTTGTLGILIEAKNRGLITRIKPCIDILREHHHFWMNNDLYQKALVLSHE